MKKLAAILVVVVALVVFLVSRDWDSPELGRSLLNQIGARTGVDVKAEGFRMNLLRGVVLENVEAKSSREGRELTIRLDRLVFEHRLAPLLSGTVAVESLVLQKPQFELVQGPAKETAPRKSEPAPAPEEGPSLPLAVEVKQIRIENGSLSVKNEKGEEKTRVSGLDLSIENVAFDSKVSSLAALSGEGTLAAQDLRFDQLALTGTECRFQLADAVFTVPELRFRTLHGSFTADAKIDFRPVPFRYELNGRGDPLDVNGMVGAKEGFGPASLKIAGKGSGPETKDLTATGRLRFAEGRFPDAEMFRRIDRVLGKRAVVGSPYEATEASFRIAGDRVTLEPFRFESGDLRADVKGTMQLEGPVSPVSFDLVLATPREGIRVEGVGSSTLDVLADDEGFVPVPLDVTGSMQDPQVSPDVKALASQAAGGVQREAQEKAIEALRGLVKKKKNE